MATSKYQGMLQERADLLRANEDMYTKAKAEGRGLNAAEKQQDREQVERLAKLEVTIAETEAQRERERGGPAPSASSFLTALPGQATGPRRPTGPHWAQMFPDAAGDRGGFQSFGELTAQMHAGLYSANYLAMLKSGDGNGTDLQIPTQFAAELMDASLEDEIVRPRARIEPMTSDTKLVAGFFHGSGVEGPYGGLGAWTAAGEEITPQDPKSQAFQLHANGLKVLVQVSNEAIADGTSIDQQLQQVLPKALGWRLDDSFFTGTGAGMPMGMINAAATITQAAEVGQTAGTVVYENLAGMLARMHGGSFNRAIWVCNPSVIPQLLTLGISIGIAGSAVPVLNEKDGSFTLLTRPVIFSEKVPALGSKGAIGLYDFSRYVVGMRADVRLEKSGHAGFTRDTTYYRCVLRADGQPDISAPYTMKNGGTVSPFVVLAAI